MMKKITVFVAMLAAMGVMAADAIKVDFAKAGEVANNWSQLKDGYYHPLGKVEAVKEGLKMSSSQTKPTFVQSKKRIPAKVGDKFEITVTLNVEIKGGFYISLFQFDERGWFTNSNGYTWVEKGEKTVTKTLEVKDHKRKATNISIALGVSDKRIMTIKTLTYRKIK